MPSSYQTEMKKMFKSTFDGINNKIRNDNKKALEVLKKNGLVVLSVPKEDREHFYNVCNKVSLKLTESEYSRSLYNKIMGYVKEYRKNK
jgi:TRAP-type C4-dicarboxylate transport system substrate-binding protein